MIDFPNAPTVGQTFTSAGVIWTWDGVKWTAEGLSVPYLPLSGGTMTGPITLAADPVAPLQPTTKEYVDALAIGDNRIINGDMRIDQRNNGAAVTPSGSTYTVDKWALNFNVSSKLKYQRLVADAPLTALGFGSLLSFTTVAAYTPAAADFFNCYQAIEADMISDFAWGTLSAKPVTLSFIAWSSLVGTFGGSITNYAQTRSYPFSYSVPVAGSYTKVSITIPGDTAGAWVMSGNAGGMYLFFDLGSGANVRAAAGSWVAGGYVGATGAVSVVGTNNAAFYVTGVKLEIGSVATPYNRQSLAKSMADCQRYYQISGNHQVGGAAVNAATIYLPYLFPVVMRSAPTVTFSMTGGSGYTTPGTATITADGFSGSANGTATAYVAIVNWIASAEL
jgi:hypothetical protein